MADLLTTWPRATAAGLRAQLLAAMASRRPTGVLAGSHRPAGSRADRGGARVPARHELVDPLSSRELDVLRYLGSDLDGPAIARELGVSLSTVRTHTQHIYAKLGVTNRRAAVRRAHQLNLFSHPTADTACTRPLAMRPDVRSRRRSSSAGSSQVMTPAHHIRS